jgi:hypothetical protein
MTLEAVGSSIPARLALITETTNRERVERLKTLNGVDIDLSQ